MNAQFKKYSLLLALAAICSVPVFGSDIENKESTKPNDEIEILDPFYYNDNPTEPRELEFYDFDDNLVYKVTVTKDDEPNAKLAKYLNESDFLTQNSKTSYFRLNN